MGSPHVLENPVYTLRQIPYSPTILTKFIMKDPGTIVLTIHTNTACWKYYLHYRKTVRTIIRSSEIGRKDSPGDNGNNIKRHIQWDLHMS